jgi:glutamyl-tRNA reductase
MARRATAGGKRPLLIVDIAVPRNVEESVRGLPGVRLYHLDDLAGVVRRTLRGRGRQRRRVRQIVEDHLEEFMEGLAVRRIGPVIDALYRRMQSVTQEELAEARRKLSAHADAAEDDLVLQRALHRSVRRILHPAAVNLRRLATSDSAHLHIQSIRRLFDLKD